jgi:glutamyl-Q tRNA(Asp) synthetase
MTDNFTTRFAPSPTGHLHLGHAFSALQAWNAARQAGGRFLLRIEDIDTGRCKPAFEAAILEDLAWLGITWEEPVRRQSEHFQDYQAALAKLDQLGLLYRCFCTRREITQEVARSPAAPHGPEGPVYPGICREMPVDQAQQKTDAGAAFALRLDLEKAISHLKVQNRWPLHWQDGEAGPLQADPRPLGDVVLARKDTPTSYHLAVTVDDALQGVSHVIRGEDLAHATHIHRLLQALLGYPVPHYIHHPLIRDAAGKRFAKRDQAATLRSLRESGASAGDILNRLAAAAADKERN